jgi:hypothetical protein
MFTYSVLSVRKGYDNGKKSGERKSGFKFFG